MKMSETAFKSSIIKIIDKIVHQQIAIRESLVMRQRSTSDERIQLILSVEVMALDKVINDSNQAIKTIEKNELY